MNDKFFAYVYCSGIDPEVGAVSCGVRRVISGNESRAYASGRTSNGRPVHPCMGSDQSISYQEWEMQHLW